MEAFKFFFLMLVTLIFIPIFIGYILYYIPKKLGKHMLGIILVSGFASYLFYIGFIQDKIFYKNDVKELLAKHHIELIDDFEIRRNGNSKFTPYGYDFILEISEKDKQRIINNIKSAKNFKTYSTPITMEKENKIYHTEYDEFFSISCIYTNEYPHHLQISISKKENTLHFFDFYD